MCRRIMYFWWYYFYFNRSLFALLNTPFLLLKTHFFFYFFFMMCCWEAKTAATFHLVSNRKIQMTSWMCAGGPLSRLKVPPPRASDLTWLRLWLRESSTCWLDWPVHPLIAPWRRISVNGCNSPLWRSWKEEDIAGSQRRINTAWRF